MNPRQGALRSVKVAAAGRRQLGSVEQRIVRFAGQKCMGYPVHGYRHLAPGSKSNVTVSLSMSYRECKHTRKEKGIKLRIHADITWCTPSFSVGRSIQGYIEISGSVNLIHPEHSVPLSK